MHIKNIVMLHIVFFLRKIACRTKLTIQLLKASDRILSISIQGQKRRLYIADGLLDTIHINGSSYNLGNHDSLDNIYAELSSLIS